MARRIDAVGRRIVVAVVDGVDETASGLLLARSIEEPFGYVLSVGPWAGPGQRLLRAVDDLMQLVDDIDEERGRIDWGAFSGDGDLLVRVMDACDTVRKHRDGPSDLKPGDLVMWRRDLGTEFDWDGQLRIACIHEHDVLGVVGDVDLPDDVRAKVDDAIFPAAG